MVTIRVGKEPDQEEFIAHESFLTCRSEFFRRAMNGHWDEAETRVIKLPDDQPKVFAVYLDCVYNSPLMSELLEKTSTGPLERMEEYRLADIDIKSLCQLYILADKLLDAITKESAMRLLFKVFEYKTSDGKMFAMHATHVSFVYDNTTEHSQLRCFTVDLWQDRSRESLRKSRYKLPTDFLVDLVVALQGKATETYRVTIRKGVEAYLDGPAHE